MPKTRRSYWLFRIVSSRGTDATVCAALPAGTTLAEARHVAERWAEEYTAGTACREYSVTYQRTAPPPGKREWAVKWKRLCDRHAAAKLAVDEWRAVQNPKELS